MHRRKINCMAPEHAQYRLQRNAEPFRQKLRKLALSVYGACATAVHREDEKETHMAVSCVEKNSFFRVSEVDFSVWSEWSLYV